MAHAAEEHNIPPDEIGGGEEESGHPTSPFFNGTSLQYAWDSTSIEAFKRCPRYYQYVIVENWQGRQDNIHLRWGQEFHTCLEEFEHHKAEGVHHDKAVHLVLRALLHRIDDWVIPPATTKGEAKKTKESLFRTVVWYLDFYQNDVAKTVILENGKPAVELSFTIEMDFGSGAWDRNYLLCGHLDKVVDFQGDRYVMDHKTTTGSLGDYWFRQWSPHTQMTVYTIAGQVLMSAPIKGVIVDGVQVDSDFKPPVRGFTLRTQDQLDEWLGDLSIHLGIAERYADEGYWPMNDTACDKYGGCRFREVCSRSPAIRQRWLQGSFTQENERWNPLKPR